jgi:hypothetical protein
MYFPIFLDINLNTNINNYKLLLNLTFLKNKRNEFRINNFNFKVISNSNNMNYN